MPPRSRTLRLSGLALALAFLAGCAGAPGNVPLPPTGGTTYTTASGAIVTVSGRVRAEGMAAR